MKTIIDINEHLIERAKKLTGAPTKKETITIALEELIKLRLRERLKGMAGSDMLSISLSGLRGTRTRRSKKLLK